MRKDRVRRVLVVAGLLLGSTCALAGVALPGHDALAAPPPPKEKDPKDKAREFAKDGIKAYDAKDPTKALELFTQAEGLFHAPTHTLYIARSLALLGKLVEAKATYQKLVDEDLGPKPIEIFAKAKESGKTELAALEARIPKIGIEVVPADAKGLIVTLNGDPLPADKMRGTLEVNPGTYTLVAKGDGRDTKPEVVEAKEGAVIPVTLRIPKPSAPPPPPPKASPLKGLGIASMVLGGSALVAGGVLGGMSFPLRDDATALFDKCESDLGKGQCTGARAEEVTAADDKATAFGNVGIGFLIGGGALVGLGVGLFVAGSKKAPADEAPATAYVVPVFGPGFAGVQGQF